MFSAWKSTRTSYVLSGRLITRLCVFYSLLLICVDLGGKSTLLHGGSWKGMLWAEWFCGQRDAVGKGMLWGQGCCGQRGTVGSRMLWGQGCCGQSSAVGSGMLWGHNAVGSRLQWAEGCYWGKGALGKRDSERKECCGERYDTFRTVLKLIR